MNLVDGHECEEPPAALAGALRTHPDPTLAVLVQQLEVRGLVALKRRQQRPRTGASAHWPVCACQLASVQRERTTWKLGKLSGAARYFSTHEIFGEWFMNE